ncbi:SDR family NAD(P)-dependent oxidoreductase [Candidatus Protochlamydia sp. W-9]|uniref:SDR family NAD(P)-dependent oxidoreductase n=1 Tax=Candidatus Protochlamydia sp. W-9 TaxID=1785087 RepID=UPI00096A55E4|nr:SDR family NAD(P)-dependent oxidoreductase [Candidatus Protochlamydia sp. W-9]
MAWTLVTGGAKRLGAHLCYALAEQGYSVVVHYNKSEQEAKDVVKKCQEIGVEAAAIQGDFSSNEAIQDFTKRYLLEFKETTNLINNVGNYFVRSGLQTPLSDWMALFQINLHAPFILIQKMIPSLLESKGQIINLGVSGLYENPAGIYSTAYRMTKSCLWMLTKSLSVELASKGVRVNMVSPGQTDFSVDLQHQKHKLPMNRPCECKEISRVITFLLHPDSVYITGQNIEIAGGS